MRPASTEPASSLAARVTVFNSLPRRQGKRLGRVNGAEAIDGYLQTKSVWTELSEEVSVPFVMKV